MTKSHLNYLIFDMFASGIETMPVKCKKTREHLGKLCQFFALYDLHQDCNVLYETGYLKPGSAQMITAAMKEIMTELRPVMIPLIESFGI